ncbi:hypothetical protein N5U59_00830 [Aliarcobacter butzleri]|nr:hypothetical protein [Aliarcobacter butzleri]
MIYIVLVLISFFLTYFIKNYMIKKSLVASVNERSSHTVPTPHGRPLNIPCQSNSDRRNPITPELKF